MYSSGFWIEENIGNNAFSWEERKALGSELKIWVPSLIEGSFDDLQVGEHIAFEEIRKNKNKQTALDSRVGLKHLIKTEREGKPVYVVDNHNHVLSFRHTFWLETQKEAALLVHIDQHTDMNIPEDVDSSESISSIVNRKVHVGSFILAAKELGVVDEVVQINTEYTLNQCLPLNKIKTQQTSKKPVIVDIDLDFWAPGMGIEHLDRSFEQVRKLCRQADLITVATSPYFLDQKLAIELSKKIFTHDVF